MAARIGPVGVATDHLAAELHALLPALERFDLSGTDGEARRLLERGVAALEDFNAKLGEVNAALRSLASRPIMGMLGGGAESELQRLGASIDRLRSVVAEVAKYVGR
jgi:hypothetical protein